MYERTYYVNNPYFEDIMNESNKKDISRLVFCLCILIVAAFCLSGCSFVCLKGCEAPGETRDEIHQRHIGILNVQKQQVQNDWDALLLLNKPSKLSDKYVR
jgi:hypothetical protein